MAGTTNTNDSMKIYFATGNKHKVEEAQIALKDSGIELVILDEEKEEPSGWDMEKVAKYNAHKFADKMKAPVIVEDTGVFFEALDDFPGAEPKRWFEKLGYDGLLAKLEGQNNRKAYFQIVISSTPLSADLPDQHILSVSLLRGKKLPFELT